MAKKNDMPMLVMEMPPYEGRVNEGFLEAAKQSSSFLNDRNYANDGMMKDMLKADLIATGKYAIENINRAVAMQIKREAMRFFDERETETWF